MTYHIIPKPDSPYATLDLPNGIPVKHPLPFHEATNGSLIFDVDLDKITAKVLLDIAKLVAVARGIDIDTVVDGIKAEDKFGISLHHVDRVVGDPKIEAMPISEIEGLARAYRAKILLEKSPVGIVLRLSLLSAIALYGELGRAVWILGSNDPKSTTAELVGNWLDNITSAIESIAPELAQVLIDKQEEDADRLTMLMNAIDLNIEIRVPIPAYTAYLAIACLQLMSRNSESLLLPEIRHYIRTLTQGVIQIAPEVNWLIERGWHPEFDGGAG